MPDARAIVARSRARRVPPRAPVDAGQDVHGVRRAQQHRQHGEERAALQLGAAAVDEEDVRDEKRPAHERRVDEELDEPARLHRDRVPEPRVSGLAAPLLLRELGEEAPELHEQGERDEDAERGHGRPVEHVVSDGGRAQRDGDQREQRDGLGLGQPVVDEPVRGVVGSPLRDGPALREAPDGDECRVEDRDGENEQRQEHRRDGRPRRRPARREAERGEEEPEQLAAPVAHEDVRAVAGPEVERQEAEARERQRERQDEDEVVLVDRRRVDREVQACDRRRASQRGRPCCRAG